MSPALSQAIMKQHIFTLIGTQTIKVSKCLAARANTDKNKTRNLISLHPILRVSDVAMSVKVITHTEQTCRQQGTLISTQLISLSDKAMR